MKFLPWFNLDNYPPHKKPEYWLEQILRRIDFENLFNSTSKGNLDYKDVFTEYVINQTPDYNLPPTKLGSIIPRERNAPAPAALTTVEEIESIWRYFDMDDKVEKHLHSRTDEVTETETEEGILYSFNPIGEPMPIPEVFLGEDLFLTIDLNHDDESIMASVLSIVKEQRAKLNDATSNQIKHRKKRISERDFANWYTYRALPMYDMLLWAKITGRSLKLSSLARLFWPDGSGDADTLRKTTMKYLAEIKNPSTQSRLASLIANQ